jgi:hypothetical protein
MSNIMQRTPLKTVLYLITPQLLACTLGSVPTIMLISRSHFLTYILHCRTHLNAGSVIDSKHFHESSVVLILRLVEKLEPYPTGHKERAVRPGPGQICGLEYNILQPTTPDLAVYLEFASKRSEMGSPEKTFVFPVPESGYPRLSPYQERRG